MGCAATSSPTAGCGTSALTAQRPVPVAVGDIQAVPEAQTTTTLDGRQPAGLVSQGGAWDPAVVGERWPRSPKPTHARHWSRPRQVSGRTLRLGTVFFQHHFQHPDPAVFAPLLAWLKLPAEPMVLLNPSAHLRLRRLELPEGAVTPVLINAGGPVTARLARPRAQSDPPDPGWRRAGRYWLGPAGDRSGATKR